MSVFVLLFAGGIMVLNGKTEIGIVVAFISGLDRVLEPWRGGDVPIERRTGGRPPKLTDNDIEAAKALAGQATTPHREESHPPTGRYRDWPTSSERRELPVTS